MRLLTAPDLKELWARMGMETPALRPEQFAAVLRPAVAAFRDWLLAEAAQPEKS